MGVFDTIHCVCPACGERSVEVQSKGNDSCQNHYDSETVPENVLECAYFGCQTMCDNCGTRWLVSESKISLLPIK